MQNFFTFFFNITLTKYRITFFVDLSMLLTMKNAGCTSWQKHLGSVFSFSLQIVLEEHSSKLKNFRTRTQGF